MIVGAEAAGPAAAAVRRGGAKARPREKIPTRSFMVNRTGSKQLIGIENPPFDSVEEPALLDARRRLDSEYPRSAAPPRAIRMRDPSSAA
jgi:hypothetical protein